MICRIASLTIATSVLVCLGTVAARSTLAGEERIDAGTASQQATPEPAPTATVSGEIRDPEGNAVGGAKVRILPYRNSGDAEGASVHGAVVTVESDDRGTFVAPDLEADLIRVLVEAERFASWRSDPVPAAEPLRIRLEPGHVVAGRTLDIETGEPAGGVSVRLWESASSRFGNEPRAEQRTDEYGRFRFSHIAAGKADLQAVGTRHALEWVRSIAVPLSENDSSEDAGLADLFLHPGGRLAGIVTDGDDGVVANAVVELRPADLGNGIDSRALTIPGRRTDDDGRFEFPGLRAEVSYRVRISHDDFARSSAGPFRIEKGGDIDDIEIRLSPGAVLSMKLLDPRGGQVTAVDIGLERQDDGSGVRLLGNRDLHLTGTQIEVAADGRITARKLPPGTYAVSVRPKRWLEVRKRDVRLREGGVTDLGEIDLSPGERLRGRITDSAGDPIEGATVTARWFEDERHRRKRVESGREGRYELSGLEETPVNITVRARGYLEADASVVEIDREDLDFTLDRGGAVRGTVELADGGVPGAFRVDVRREADLESNGVEAFMAARRELETRTVEDPAGAFEVDGLREGTYTVEVRAEGMAPGRSTGVEVRVEGTTDVGRIVLERGLALRGQVVDDESGAPVPGAAVGLAAPIALPFPDRDHGSAGTTVSAVDGTFQLRGLEAGNYDLTVEHPRFSQFRTTTRLQAEAPPDPIEIRMRRGGSLSGTVTGSDGMPLEGVEIILVHGLSVDERHVTSTGNDGRYEFERLASGMYTVARQPTGSRGITGLDMRKVVIREAEASVVDFDDRPAIRMTGTVVRDGRAVIDAGLMFFPGNHGSFARDAVAARSDCEGLYQVDLQQDGVHTVYVSLGGPGFTTVDSSVQIMVPDEAEVRRDIVLHSARVRGKVVDTGGRPVTNAKIAAMREGVQPGVSGSPSAVLSVHDGTYDIDGLEPGVYTVTASAAGLTTSDRTGVTLSVDAPAVVDFTLESGPVVRGQVFDPHGRPVHGAKVWIVSSDAWAGLRGEPHVTDIEGRFEGIAPTLGTIDVVAVGGAAAPATVRRWTISRDSGGSELILQLTFGGSIRARVVGPDGTPGAGAMVFVVPTERVLRIAHQLAFRLPPPTGTDGLASFDHLAPGAYEVFVVGADVVEPVTVEVYEGSESSVTVVVQGS